MEEQYETWHSITVIQQKRKIPGCKYDGIHFFWDRSPRQLENTSVLENITASIFIGLAVQTLKIEGKWCRNVVSIVQSTQRHTLETQLSHQKYYEKSNLASEYKKIVLFTATIFYSVVSISLWK